MTMRRHCLTTRTWWILSCFLCLISSSVQQHPSNSPKSPIRPPKQSATRGIENDKTLNEAPTPLTFEIFHNPDHDAFFSSKAEAKTTTLFKPSKVATAWYELLNKRFNYVEDASILYLHHLVDPFSPELLQRFNDITEPLPVMIGVECSTENNHIYNSIEDIEGFYKYFYIARLHFSSLRHYWKRYANFSSNSAIAEVDLEDISANRDHPLFDFIMSLSGELNALQLMESRFISILDPAFLFGDFVIDPELETADKEFIRHHRHLCVHTHIAAAHDLQEVIQFVLENARKFAKGICGVDISEISPEFNLDDMDGTSDNRRLEDENEVLRFDDDGNLIDENGNILESRESKAREKVEREDGKSNIGDNFQSKQSRNRKRNDKGWSLRTLRRFVSTFHTSPRYKNINQRLYDFIFYHYKEKYLFPYMTNEFCDSYKREMAINQTKIILTRAGRFYQDGEDHEFHLIVSERTQKDHVPIDECLVGVKTSVFVHEDALRETFKECTIKVRHLFFTSNATKDTEAAILRRSEGGGSLTARELACFLYFDEISFQDESFCLPLAVDAADYNVLNLLSAAIVSPDMLIESIRYPQPNSKPVGGTGLADPFMSFNDHTISGTKDIIPENSVPLLFSRSLILGFGGGELHHSLIKTFPFMSVESIEISIDVLITAMEQLGMKHLLCDIEQYDAKSKRFYSIYDDLMAKSYSGNSRSHMEKQFFSCDHYTNVLQHKYYQFESFYDLEHPEYHVQRGLPPNDVATDTVSKSKRSTHDIHEKYFSHIHDLYGKEDFSCRSKVRVMDAWHFVDLAYMKVLEEESRKKEEWFNLHHSLRMQDIVAIFEDVGYYDYIFFDVYDEKSTFWDGMTFLGESVPGPSKVLQSIHKLKHIVRPFTGIVIAHFHKDQSFKTYYDKMCEVFGSQQVTVFDVTLNDALIIAARDRFTSLENDEFQFECQMNFDRNGEQVERCVRVPLKPMNQQHSKGDEHDEEEEVFENMYLGNSRYHFLTHPCGEEDKMAVPRELVMLARRFDFTPRMTLMYLLGLNCYPMTSYPRVLAASQSEMERKGLDGYENPTDLPTSSGKLAGILQPTHDEYEDNDYEL